ncbi:oleosin Cor a 15-like [Aristolochia californica]|uniref:oleosin Cor a 15-like n=1 Tax=Aristolochia californica TaxID=171875 RepID=UPI0035D9DEEC
MAEHQQHHPGHQAGESLKGILPEKGPSSSQVIAVIALFPVGGILLTLSGLTLAASIIGLLLATPVFLIFSPVLVPAAIVLSLAVTGFLTSGAFGITGLSSLSWIVNYFRGAREKVPEQLEYAKRRMADAAGHVGQRTKEMGQTIQGKGHEGGRGGHEERRT